MNTERQRDAGMDRLLRAALAEDASVPRGACPDADTVAAYADGGLTTRERTDIEPHLASCARCQSTIAMMAYAADIAKSPTQSLTPARPGWRAWFTIPRLQWLVPASAAALALLLYVAVKPGPATVPGQEAAPLGVPAPEFTMAQRSSEAPAPAAEPPESPAPPVRQSPGASPPLTGARSERSSTMVEAAQSSGRSTIGSPAPPLAQGLALPAADSVSAAPPAAPAITAAAADVVMAVPAGAPAQALPSAALAAGNVALADATKGRPLAEGAVAERGAVMSRAPEAQRDARAAETALVGAQKQAKRVVLVDVSLVRTGDDVDSRWARADFVVRARAGDTRPAFLSRERIIEGHPGAAAPIVATGFSVLEVFKRADSIPPAERFVMWQVGSEAADRDAVYRVPAGDWVAIRAGDEYVLFLNRRNLLALPNAVTPSAGPSSVLRLDSVRPDFLARLRQLAGTARRGK